jgi:hypothetical protein
MQIDEVEIKAKKCTVCGIFLLQLFNIEACVLKVSHCTLFPYSPLVSTPVKEIIRPLTCVICVRLLMLPNERL